MVKEVRDVFIQSIFGFLFSFVLGPLRYVLPFFFFLRWSVPVKMLLRFSKGFFPLNVYN